jgi:S1-C subfamily serine protease
MIVNRRTLLGGLALTLATGAAAQKKERGVMRADRAGWMLGMFVGDSKRHAYPFVTEVDPKSDAYRKGVRPGDELIRFEGKEVADVTRVFDRVNELREGSEVEAWFRRGSQNLQIMLRVPKYVGASPEDRVSNRKPRREGEEKPKRKVKVVIREIPVEGEEIEK